MSKTVDYVVADGVATISLNRPHRLNAINGELLHDFATALGNANAGDDVRVIVLRGEGRAFCAGDDLKEFEVQSASRAKATAYVEAIQDITRALVFNHKMVVVAVHGWAVGGGLEWVINCDFVVAARDTQCFLPETRLGIFVTGAVTALLPRQIGIERTRRLILLGDSFTAEEGAAMGFDWTLAEPSDVEAQATQLAMRIAALPQGSVRHLKRALTAAPFGGLEAAMTMETAAAVDGFLDPESRQRALDAIEHKEGH